MENRFKFRAWNKDMEEMCDSAPPLEEKREYYPFGICVGFSHYNSDDLIVMQCTELPDKNDKLIYENDIIKAEILNNFDEHYGQYIIFKVIFEDYSWKAKKLYQTKNDEEFGLDSLWFSELTDEDLFDNIEIIGNIYENPELLIWKEGK